MIIQSLARRNNLLLRSATQAARCMPQPSTHNSQRRCLHNVPVLRDDDILKRNGIDGLFTPDGFDIAWTKYQTAIINELNSQTVGTEFDKIPPQALIIKTARDPNRASIFNHASMAFNNHFFFRGITRDPSAHPISSTLKHALETTFSSLPTLRSEFLATATAMFGPGFVWLVQQRTLDGDVFRILPTYLAGSPFPGAHYRQQSLDMNTQNPDSLTNLSPEEHDRQTNTQNFVGSAGPHARGGGGRLPETSLGGADVIPLLCVNTWEHVWLRDWDVTGKRQFLEAWWDRIDWSVVEASAQMQRMKGRGFLSR
ncbi:manganese and iron superoxide dismutase [Lepidopterella palustris CBS 459.81]|uniref:Manganese and iron superoxide dismutase n=1 Tax=Lepidopterella palustris CBS 459.81 TaxID=1314670 RepID=A0A8E2E4N3_9PEZI|nr:manganese and iron superoxide dismutase [Lepidopterella palustris CBS 459.81]